MTYDNLHLTVTLFILWQWNSLPLNNTGHTILNVFNQYVVPIFGLINGGSYLYIDSIVSELNKSICTIITLICSSFSSIVNESIQE